MGLTFFILVLCVLSGCGVSAENFLRGLDWVDEYADMPAVPVSFANELVSGNDTAEPLPGLIRNGSRCRSAPYTDVQAYENNERLRALPPETPSEALRVRSIRVYMHIIMSSSGQGNVPDSVINAQLGVMNRAYAGSMFSFALAGTTRTKNDAWYSAKLNSAGITAMKRALRKGSYSDLNVYTTAQSDSTLGWASLPTKVGTDIRFDGVVIDYRTMPGGTFYPYNLGHTLTHETGHWLGLAHTFQGGCAVDPARGDEIPDTPAEKEGNFGCPAANTNSCKGNIGALKGRDPIHNYMNYVDDGCMDNFTADQGKRMRRMFQLYRTSA